MALLGLSMAMDGGEVTHGVRPFDPGIWPRCPLKRRLSGPQRRSGFFGEGKKMRALTGNGTTIAQCTHVYNW